VQAFGIDVAATGPTAARVKRAMAKRRGFRTGVNRSQQAATRALTQFTPV